MLATRADQRRPRAVLDQVLCRCRLPAHQATTAVLPAAYPFLAETGLGARGSYIGRDLFGGAFCYDPFELYARGLLTNPNMLVAGAVGSGKSSFVKTLLFRAQAFGRSAWVADPKGEYGDLAAACGITPVSLGPGLAARLNPLDPGPSAADDEPDRQARLRLVLALATAALGRPVTPLEHAATDIAIRTVAGRPDPPVLPDLVRALLHPDAAAAAGLELNVEELVERSRDVALVLRRMCTGDLAGMFDGPTTVRPDAAAPLTVLDLSAVYQQNRDALPLVMTCATAWLHNAVARDGGQRYVVIDEAWALLSTLGTARWLQQSFKLARAHGVANIAVLHRFSDLAAAGDASSETVALARGLLADTGTRVVYAQPPGELAEARRLLGLTGPETELLPTLRQGVALWKVAGRSFVVEHRRSEIEATFTDTDAAMTR